MQRKTMHYFYSFCRYFYVFIIFFFMFEAVSIIMILFKGFSVNYVQKENLRKEGSFDKFPVVVDAKQGFGIPMIFCVCVFFLSSLLSLDPRSRGLFILLFSFEFRKEHHSLLPNALSHASGPKCQGILRKSSSFFHQKMNKGIGLVRA